MRIGVDLDGCVHDFHKSLTDYLCMIEHDWKIDAESEPQDWHFYRHWGMSDEEFVATCNAGVDAGVVFRGNIHDGAADAIASIRAAGHTIHIITDRQFGSTPEASHRATKEWLAEHGIAYDTLTFSADKTVVQTDMMVEDKIQNYDALTAAGTMVFLINRPWNMPAGDGRYRVNSISEFAHVVLAFDKYMATSVQ